MRKTASAALFSHPACCPDPKRRGTPDSDKGLRRKETGPAFYKTSRELPDSTIPIPKRRRRVFPAPGCRYRQNRGDAAHRFWPEFRSLRDQSDTGLPGQQTVPGWVWRAWVMPLCEDPPHSAPDAGSDHQPESPANRFHPATRRLDNRSQMIRPDHAAGTTRPGQSGH